MENSQLLDMAMRCPGKLFSGVDKQRILLLKMALTEMPCPNCGRLQNQLDASGITLDEYTFGAEERLYRCVGCRRELRVHVPFIAMGPQWHWGLVPVPQTGQNDNNEQGDPNPVA